MLKPVLVTGASSGIGEATAIHLSRKGFNVFAGARRFETLKALEGLGQGGITAVKLDVTDPNSIRQAINDINEKAGPLYGLVNNAGIAVPGPVEDVDIDGWRRQFETNVFSVVAMSQAVIPQMRAAGAGRIINIGSVAGRVAAPFMGVYASSKHALEGVSDAMRRELSLHGIKVVHIRPGFTNTNFGPHEQEGLAPFAEGEGPNAPYVAVMKKWHSKQHVKGASPLDVAEAVHRGLTTTNPRARYTVPRYARYLTAGRSLLPAVIFDRLIMRTVGLKRS
ncbi:MAG: SDR family oxidoreductase [Pseudomonadota bacterium]